MLKFSSMAPELERLNELGYRLPLNDSEIKRMQNLNRGWSTASAQTTERFRYGSKNVESSSISSAFIKVKFWYFFGSLQQAPVLPAAAANFLGKV